MPQETDVYFYQRNYAFVTKKTASLSRPFSATHFQALACHHAALCITISHQSCCLKTVVSDAMLEISR